MKRLFLTDTLVMTSDIFSQRLYCPMELSKNMSLIMGLPVFGNEPFSSLKVLLDDIAARTNTVIELGPRDQIEMLTVTITGTAALVMEARTRIFFSGIHQTKKRISLPANLNPVFGYIKPRIEELGQALGVVIDWDDSDSHSFVVAGCAQSVDRARLLISIMLDEVQDKKTISFRLDPVAIGVLSGKCRTELNKILSPDRVAAYLPNYFRIEQDGEPPVDHEVYLSGEDQVLIDRTRDEIYNHVAKKQDSLISQSLLVSSKKVEVLLNEHDDLIRETCFENGCYVRFVWHDQERTSLIVYSDNIYSIETVLKRLCKHIYEIQSFEMVLSSEMKSVHGELHDLARTHHLEVGIWGSRIELHGNSRNLIGALENVARSYLGTELYALNQAIVQVRFSMEAGLEDRDFICGKKNGKLNKIMKMAKSTIRIIPWLELSIQISITGRTIYSCVCSHAMIEDELPSSISFYIPENHHKRIIGHGGKSIQKIMRTFGVYVKFLNQEEIRQKYPDNTDFCSNVLVKTPSKNLDSLEQMKSTLLELSGEPDHTLVTEHVPIPHRFHVYMANQSARFEELRQTFGASVCFFPAEWYSDTIILRGSSDKMRQAKKFLFDMTPEFVHFQLENVSDTWRQLESKEFLLERDLILESQACVVIPSRFIKTHYYQPATGPVPSHLGISLALEQGGQSEHHTDRLAAFFTRSNIRIRTSEPMAIDTRQDVDPFKCFGNVLLSCSSIKENMGSGLSPTLLSCSTIFAFDVCRNKKFVRPIGGDRSSGSPFGSRFSLDGLEITGEQQKIKNESLFISSISPWMSSPKGDTIIGSDLDGRYYM